MSRATGPRTRSSSPSRAGRAAAAARWSSTSRRARRTSGRMVVTAGWTPRSTPSGSTITEAVYAPGDPHCCPSSVRTTTLVYTEDGGSAPPPPRRPPERACRPARLVSGGWRASSWRAGRPSTAPRWTPRWRRRRVGRRHGRDDVLGAARRRRRRVERSRLSTGFDASTPGSRSTIRSTAPSRALRHLRGRRRSLEPHRDPFGGHRRTRGAMGRARGRARGDLPDRRSPAAVRDDHDPRPRR